MDIGRIEKPRKRGDVASRFVVNVSGPKHIKWVATGLLKIDCWKVFPQEAVEHVVHQQGATGLLLVEFSFREHLVRSFKELVGFHQMDCGCFSPGIPVFPVCAQIIPFVDVNVWYFFVHWRCTFPTSWSNLLSKRMAVEEQTNKKFAAIEAVQEAMKEAENKCRVCEFPSCFLFFDFDVTTQYNITQ